MRTGSMSLPRPYSSAKRDCDMPRLKLSCPADVAPVAADDPFVGMPYEEAAGEGPEVVESIMPTKFASDW